MKNVFTQIMIGMMILVLGGVVFVNAQEINLTVEVDRNPIALGSSARLSIAIEGTQDVAPPEIPEIDGLDIQYMGPASRVTIVNGRRSVSKTFSYSLFAIKEGSYDIPSFTMDIDGKTYSSQPVNLKVVDSSVQTQSVEGQTGGVSIKDKLFVALKVPKEDVYLNERVPVKILLFYSGLNMDQVQYPQIDSLGFSIDEYAQPQQYQQVINGLRFNIVEYDTMIYPTRVGSLTLGPVKVECVILVKGQDQKSSHGGLFDDAFFGSFFESYERRPFMVESEAIVLNVRPLPEEGKPSDFSGGVGQFDFKVTVSPVNIKEGDPITFRAMLKGNGNLGAITMPTIKDEQFKLYDPKITEKDNVKEVEQVIIPNSAKTYEIPAINFSYFNPELKKYQTIKQGPFPINVEELKRGEAFQIVGVDDVGVKFQSEELGEDIVFIKERAGRFRIKGEALHKSVSFFALAIFLLGGWLTAYFMYKRTHRLKTDVVYARRLLAPKQAKGGLTRAKKLISEHKKEEFYNEVFKTIQQYLGNKLHLSSGAVTFEAVRTLLENKKIDEKILTDIKNIFEECDVIRYALATINEEKMNTSFDRLAHVIDHLERCLR